MKPRGIHRGVSVNDSFWMSVMLQHIHAVGFWSQNGANQQKQCAKKYRFLVTDASLWPEYHQAGWDEHSSQHASSESHQLSCAAQCCLKSSRVKRMQKKALLTLSQRQRDENNENRHHAQFGFWSRSFCVSWSDVCVGVCCSPPEV